MQSGDTIVAISSPVGAACARIIVRLSGPQSQCLTESLLDPDRKQAIPGATSAAICWLRFGRFPGVPAWIYLFIAPHSVTGEDVIELHLPGSVLLARALLAELMNRGARHAEPGEFTARGFFNGKFDLAEAEGVAAIIAAHSQAQLDAARRMMSGELARRLTPAMESITQTLALLEAGIDFADEGVTILSEDALAVRIDGAVAELRGLLEASVRFERLVHEPTVVLAGRPNAGKSTLLNALAGYERAIVSPVAGTTRDALGATVRLARGLIHVIDVAGFDAPKSSEIERQMHETASRNVETSDVVVLICDSTDDRPPIKLLREPDMTVFSKSDLVSTPGRSDALVVSALTGAGMDLLRAGLDELCFARTSMGQVSGITLGARHIASIEAAVKSLRRARAATASGAELVALDLREALDELGSILGLITRDDVLGRVFSTFCIGK